MIANPDWLRYCKRVIRAGLGTDHLIEPDVKIPMQYLGSDYGGWTVATGPLRQQEAPVVLSFGLGDDISFDEDLVRSFGARVYGFDPTPASLGWLESHGKPLGMQVFPIGIADFDGEQTFLIDNRETRGNFSAKQRTGVSVECPVKRYASILEMLGLNEVDILKLDIEGAEYEVIPDVVASSVLPKQFLIEFHHRLHNIDVSETRRCVAELQRAGYSLFAVSPGGRELSFILD